MSNLIPTPRIINEWRDTLFTGAVMGLTVSGVMTVQTALETQLLRELVRDMAWTYDPPKQVVGGPHLPDVYKVQKSVSAAFWTVGFMNAACHFMKGEMTPMRWTLLALEVCLLTKNVFEAGGFASVLKHYSEAWDWPRKEGGGGGPETKKLTDGIGKLFTALTPAPAGASREALEVVPSVDVGRGGV